MHCSNCGICCEETMMELSSDDVERLKEMGYHLEEFVVIDDYGTRLRNVEGYCFFYSRADKKCKIYRDRPLGCYIYPVVYMVKEGAFIDELCPMGKTVSKKELKRKEKILDKLLKKIDNEIVLNNQRVHMPGLVKMFLLGHIKGDSK